MDNKTIIEELKAKVELLIADNMLLKKELAKANTDRDRAISQRRNSEVTISTLEKRVKVLEIKGSLIGNKADNRAARLRINTLIKEIDSCIALMNK